MSWMKEIKFTLCPDLMAFSDKSAEEELRLPVKEINDGWQVWQKLILTKCQFIFIGHSFYWLLFSIGKSTISPSANLLSDSVSELPGERGIPRWD